MKFLSIIGIILIIVGIVGFGIWIRKIYLKLKSNIKEKKIEGVIDVIDVILDILFLVLDLLIIDYSGLDSSIFDDFLLGFSLVAVFIGIGLVAMAI